MVRFFYTKISSCALNNRHSADATGVNKREWVGGRNDKRTGEEQPYFFRYC